MSVVYTALFGNYEKLIEQPIALTTDVPFVCFTDNPDLVSDTWQVVLVKPRFPWDPTRSARWIKATSGTLWSEHGTSLWIDNRVVLKRDPEELLSAWLAGGQQMALPLHSYRETVRDEFAAVLDVGYDQGERVREQLFQTETWYPEVLTEKPYWTAILARNHSEEVRSAMSYWIDMVLRHSRRDQLSINLALTWADLKVRAIDIDNHESEWHRWERVGKQASILFGDSGWNYSLGLHLADSVRRRASRVKQWAADARDLRKE